MEKNNTKDLESIDKTTLSVDQVLTAPIVAPRTFTLTWKDAQKEPPTEGGRFWCIVTEQNDLGKSHFQWNCSYHELEKKWTDNFETVNVIWWTELPPIPS